MADADPPAPGADASVDDGAEKIPEHAENAAAVAGDAVGSSGGTSGNIGSTGSNAAGGAEAPAGLLPVPPKPPVPPSFLQHPPAGAAPAAPPHVPPAHGMPPAVPSFAGASGHPYAAAPPLAAAVPGHPMMAAAGYPHAAHPHMAMAPPSPQQPWQEARAADGRTYYFNAMTGQTTWKRPAEMPPPLPPGWMETRTPQGKVYYVNMQTRASTYTRPTVQDDAGAGDGASAAGGSKTKKVTGKVRVGSTPWFVARSADGRTFFYNSKTKKSTFKLPASLEGVELPSVPTEDEDKEKMAQEQQEKKEEDKAEEAEKDKAEEEASSDEEDRIEIDAPLIKDEEYERMMAEQQAEQQAAAAAAAGGAEANDDDDDDDDEIDPETGLPMWQVRMAQEQLEMEEDQEDQGAGSKRPFFDHDHDHDHDHSHDFEHDAKRSRIDDGHLDTPMPPIPPVPPVPPPGLHPHDMPPAPPVPPVPPPMLHPDDVAEIHRRAAAAPADVAPPQLSRDEKLEQFHELLVEHAVSAFSTFELMRGKLEKDPRFELLGKKERKRAFEDYVKARKESEAQEKLAKLAEAKSRFCDLLEQACEKLAVTTSYSEFQRRNRRDPRFTAIEKAKDREAMYKAHMAGLKIRRKSAPRQIREEFYTLLREQKVTHDSTWASIEGVISDKPRARAVGSSEACKRMFEDFVADLRKQRERADEIAAERKEASLRQRQREVALDRSRQQAEVLRERGNYEREEGTAQFQAMLVDFVRVENVDYDTALPRLQRDPRWEMAKHLSEGQLRRLFADHIAKFGDRRRQAFHALIDQTESITFVTPWDEAKLMISFDDRFAAFGASDEERKHEYEVHQRVELAKARDDFMDLLRETRCIDHTSLKRIAEAAEDGSNVHMREIMAALQLDRRFTVLECVSEDRGRLLQSYLQSLEERGAAPPPTASRPEDN